MRHNQDEGPKDISSLLSSLAGEDYCYLSTKGRVSGRAHEIEIWFGVQAGTLYLLAGDRKSDWVKNLLKDAAVTVHLANYTFAGTARIVKDEQEDMLARQLVAEKYQEWSEDKSLSTWARTALAVALDLHSLKDE
jgi:deazaflavin-dependent oxidoreductase (nitroreductase family)